MSTGAPPLPSLSFVPLDGLPEIEPGDDLATVLQAAAGDAAALRDGDVLIVSQKIVSKAEGRYVELDAVEAGDEARALAQRCGKDPRLVELVLRESAEVLRVAPGVLIVRHRLGFVVANAAIDQSNLAIHARERALLLPVDPDASARRLRDALQHRIGLRVAVLVSDSFGRAWRMGVCGCCIGCAGLQALVDIRGRRDRSGRSLQVTQLAIADQLCASATLVSGEADEGRPVVIVRGVPAAYFGETRNAASLLRPLEQDLFR